VFGESTAQSGLSEHSFRQVCQVCQRMALLSGQKTVKGEGGDGPLRPVLSTSISSLEALPAHVATVLAVRCYYPMCKPPFTEKSAPVAKPDSSEATQDTIDAMSSGVPRRLTGMPAMILSSTS